MIYVFRITSAEKPDFSRQLSLDAQHTFADFHCCIQKACHYGPEQLASFFLPGKYTGKQIEVTQLDLGPLGFPTHVMERTLLKQLLHYEQQRLLYVYDFFQDRSFYIELIQIFMEKNLLEPAVTENIGDAPAQILEEEVQDQSPESPVLEEKYDYGDLDDYNEIYGEMEDLMEGL